MDELEKKAQQGLDAYSQSGDVYSVKSELDGLVDDMLGDDEENPVNKGKKSNRSWIYISIVILCMALLGYLGYRDGSKVANSSDGPVLYAQYFEVLPDMISASERSTDVIEDDQNEVDQGMAYYNMGNYNDAAVLLKKEKDPDHLVYAAISELKNQNIKAAIDLLNECQSIDKNGKYLDITEWYLSLAYLKDGKAEVAKNKLKKIASSEKHYKKKEAISILAGL